MIIRRRNVFIGGIVAFLLVFCVSGIVAAKPDPVFETATQRRLHRILTGRSDKSRANMINRLSHSREDLHRDINVVIQAARDLLKQRAELFDTSTDTQIVGLSEKDQPDSLIDLLWVLSGDPSPGVGELMIETIDHPDESISMTAMDVVGKLGLKQAVDRLDHQIRRPAFERRYAYRFSLVRAIAMLHHPKAIEVLNRLAGQLDGQLRHEVTERLEQVDVRDFEGDMEAFESWQASHPISDVVDRVFLDIETEPSPVVDQSKGSIELKPVSSSSQERPKLSKSQYYGIDLTAARMLFIIDRSGSMREPAHYSTRLQSAKDELIRTINGLSPDTEFGLMIFDTTVQLYREELIPASKDNKREATAFVSHVYYGEKTNTYDALVKATDFDDQLEAVFMLTDGRPTFGKVRRPDAIIDEIVRRNRSRHLKFHTIGIGHLGETVLFLKTLAEETGGEFRQVP